MAPIMATAEAILRFVDDGLMFSSKLMMQKAFAKAQEGSQPWHQLETVLN